jgi:hypothetical protein
MGYSRQVVELARPIPTNYVRDDGRGNSYVPHHIITQRLIAIFGTPPQIEVLREIYDAEVLTGVVMRLTVPGLPPVEEAGEADNPQSKTNGARAKDACSDAIKRCAMRLGLGLHLWSQGDYFLHREMVSSNGETSGAAGEGADPASPETSEEVAADSSDAVGAGEAEKVSPAPSGYSNKPDDGHTHQAQTNRPGWVFCPLCGQAERLSDAMDSGNWEKPE